MVNTFDHLTLPPVILLQMAMHLDVSSSVQLVSGFLHPVFTAIPVSSPAGVNNSSILYARTAR